jgi:hypothetical protein
MRESSCLYHIPSHYNTLFYFSQQKSIKDGKIRPIIEMYIVLPPDRTRFRTGGGDFRIGGLGQTRQKESSEMNQR